MRNTADYIRADHPLIAIREMLNQALRGLVLQALYGVRSERLLCEQPGYNMLYRWFVGWGMEDAARDYSTYTPIAVQAALAGTG
ncbi:MAG: transposase [Pseudomonadota bacterium]